MALDYSPSRQRAQRSITARMRRLTRTLTLVPRVRRVRSKATCIRAATRAGHNSSPRQIPYSFSITRGFVCLCRYQDDVMEPTCLASPEGYYSDEIGATNFTICPAGSYCPTATMGPSQYALLPPALSLSSTLSLCRSLSLALSFSLSNPTSCSSRYLCPNGTYSNVTGLKSATQCTPCDPGDASY